LRQRRFLALEAGAFGFFGFFWGVFSMLIADLSRALGLSPGPLGIALFVGAAASIVSMASLGWTADLLGRRRFIAVSAAVFGVGIVGVASAGSYAALLAGLVVLYAASGLYDVGINAAAVDLEQAAGRRFMALLHAAFSGGGVVGALLAGALLQAGLDYRLVYLAVLAPLVAVILAVSTARFPEPRGDASVSGSSAKNGDRSLYRNAPLMMVAVIATLGLLSEGEMENWSGLYLRDSLGLPALVGGSGVAVFFAAMAVGRLGAAGAISRFGNRRTLLSAGLLTAAGMTLSLATTRPSLVGAGFLIVGLALSAVVPIAFSVAGDLAPDRAGAAVSVVTTLGYGGFLMGPVLVGLLAEAFSLRLAFGTVVIAGILVVAISSRLGSGLERGSG
jgi:MFS family permease